MDLNVLENRLNDTTTEARCLHDRNAWLGLGFAMKGNKLVMIRYRLCPLCTSASFALLSNQAHGLKVYCTIVGPEFQDR
jgi:hypothetical protein